MPQKKLFRSLAWVLSDGLISANARSGSGGAGRRGQIPTVPWSRPGPALHRYSLVVRSRIQEDKADR